MRCTKCGAFMPDDSKFCGDCGTELSSSVVCPYCHTSLGPDDVFCYSCGRNVASAAPAAPAAPMAPAAKSSQGTNIAIIILSVILVLMISAVAAFLVFGHFNSDTKTTQNTEKITAPASTPVPAPTSVPAPVFTMADASSIRGTDTEGGQYSVSSVLSPDPMTKWVPAKSADSGINEWIKIYSYTDQYVNGIQLLNGYHKNATTWGYNNRVRYCTVTLSDGSSRDFTVPDTMDLITLDFGQTVKTSSIKLTITGVYRGTKWNDTAITYLGAY